MATLCEQPPSDWQSRPIGYQSWHDLLFLHWRVPPETLAGLLPRGLTLDTWDRDAWIGLVAFHMSAIRPWWSPPIPYFSAFPETNVRTYVRCGAEEPGIWFFSLEAARLAAVLVARWRWRLNYHWARMRAFRGRQRACYSSRRFSRGSQFARIEAEIGPPITGEFLTNPPGIGSAGTGPAGAGSIDDAGFDPAGAPPGTLEHFLAERYVFYNRARDGCWQQGRVRHAPYRLCSARLLTCEQSLLPAAGLDVAGPPCHVLFSPRVDAEVEPLRRLSEAPA